MKHREFKNIQVSPSLYGLGCMRLPTLKNEDENSDENKIDEEQAIEMIRYALDNGVSYIDTAYPYHRGKSEELIGKALQDGYREKAVLATKLPVWLVEKREDLYKYINEQLNNLQTDYVDFYLLHALDKSRWEKMLELDILSFLEEMKAEGKIKHIAFSFHDDLNVFKEIIDSYNWDMCQIQFNIIDENYQAGLEGYNYAKEKGIPVVIMEPLKGGMLTKHVPDDVMELYNSYDEKLSPAAWAFKFAANFENVMTILSGASSLEQIKDSIEIFKNLEPNSLTEKDTELLRSVKNKYNEKIKVPCTSCRYCVPCPSNVEIPEIFKFYNHSQMFDFEESKRQFYKLEKEGLGPSSCIECGKCEGECPQHIKIIESLKEAKECFR